MSTTILARMLQSVCVKYFLKSQAQVFCNGCATKWYRLL